MTLSSVAVKRPVFTVMIMVGLLVLGLVGFRRLGSDLFPDVSFPAVVVTVPYPGASPEEVETLISKPMEDAVVSINGIDRVRSFSREGSSLVFVLFELGVDVNEAATEVRERVSQVRYKLPDEAKEPIISRFDVSASPILTYTLRGSESLSELRDYAEDVIAPALEQVEGVAAVEVSGGAEREIRVMLDRPKLDALGLTLQGLVARLRAENLNVPAGHFDEGTREVSVRTVGEFQSTEQIREVIVATAKDGSVVRLSDVASVDDGFADLRTQVRVNGKDGVVFSIRKQSGKNTVEVSDGVKAKLAAIEGDFPQGWTAAPIIDLSRFIKDSVKQVEEHIALGGLMAVLVILVFMMDLRSTLISAIALPTSVIGTFFAMYLLGFTLNMMSLLALSLAIGLLIDDAVVVRENIFKHIERGKPPMQAALDGTQEVALSVFATTLTIVAVFMPVAFVGGMVGQFFRQFGITISVAVMISLFVAFTLDPMLSSRFSKVKHPGEKDRFAALKAPFEWIFQQMEQTYAAMLEWSLRHKLLVAGLSLGSMVVMGWASSLMGSEFVNSEDRGQFVVESELPAGTGLAETSRLSDMAERQLLEHPQVTTVFSTIGVDGESNKVKWRVVTTPKDQRNVNIQDIKAAGRAAALTIPGARVTAADPPFVEGAATEAPIMINVQGDNYPEIEAASRKIEDILRRTPGVSDIQVRYSPGRPELQVKVDRQQAADRGLSLAEVAMALRTAMDGSEAGNLRDKDNEVPIVVRLSEDYRQDASALANMTLQSPSGPVKLGDIARFERLEGPQVIERENRKRQITIWATPIGRPLGDVAAEFEPAIAKADLGPVTVDYDGQIRMMHETNTNMLLALLLGVVFIYLVLASQFESFIHPLTIMLTLPLALVGGVLGLFLTKNTMAMGAMIGIVLLMGLVTKNAILLIDRAIVRVRDQGESPAQAVREAGPERLRPILMTSAAMVLGMLPTAVSNAEGSEFRAPMAIAVIGGVVSSTLLSLIVVPVFYLAIENTKASLARKLWRRNRHDPAAADVSGLASAE